MIVRPLREPDLPGELAARIVRCLAWMRAVDSAIEEGEHTLPHGDAIGRVEGYSTTPASERSFESHRRHLDLQLLLEGAERILHAPADSLEVAGEYDPDADRVLYRDPPASSSILLTPGILAIFQPGDAHKPGCMAGGRHRVRKMVVKVPL